MSVFTERRKEEFQDEASGDLTLPPQIWIIRPVHAMTPLIWAATLSFVAIKSSRASATLELQSDEPPVPSQPALLPAVHWDHDHDPYIQHAFAQVSTDLHYPAAILGHSGYVDAVQFQGRDLIITFTDKVAFEFAQKSWASVPSFVLVTYSAGCGTSNEQRTFWLVDHFQPGGCDTCITASIKKELAIEDVMHGVDLTWGTYSPSSAGRTKSRRSVSPSASASAFSSGQLRSKAESRSLRRRQGSSDVPGCGPAPAPLIDGFPTATCNSPTFDQDLDDKLGYFDFSEDQYDASVRAFAPGLEDYSPSEDPGARLRRSVGLVRRGFFGDLFKAVGKGISYVVKEVFSKPLALAESLAKVVISGYGLIAAVAKVIDVDQKLDLTVPVSVVPPNLVESPWFQAKQLYDVSKTSSNEIVEGSVAVYCVRCGEEGSVHLSGRFKWRGQLEAANIAMAGSFAAGLGIGIDAQLQARKSFKAQFISSGFPGFSVPGVFTVGPMIALDAETDLGISLQGQVLAGANMSIADFSANLDLVDFDKSFTRGFDIQIVPIFEAKAQIAAHASFGLPLLIGFRKTVSITDKPSIEADITYTASTTCIGLQEDDTCVNGVKYGLNFVNDNHANFFGDKKYDILKNTENILQGCKRCSSTTTATAAPVETDAFGDPIVNYFTQPYSEYVAAASFIGAAPIEAVAVPTDASGNPLLPFNTLGAPVSGLQTPTVFGVPAAETDAFGNPYESAYSIDEKDAPANSPAFQAISEAALANADAHTDSTFFTIPDLENQYAISANDVTGNLEIALAGEGSHFIAEGGYVVGDDSRFFHYYPDVMQQYGVSRIRLSNESEIPLTTHFISLTPVNYNDNNETKNVYAAVDTLANYYLLATCNIQGQASKIFLVADPDEGIGKLLDEQLRFTVTGGVVEVCYFISWTQPPSPDAIQPGPAIIPIIEDIKTSNTSNSSGSPSESRSSSVSSSPRTSETSARMMPMSTPIPDETGAMGGGSPASGETGITGDGNPSGGDSGNVGGGDTSEGETANMGDTANTDDAANNGGAANTGDVAETGDTTNTADTANTADAGNTANTANMADTSDTAETGNLVDTANTAAIGPVEIGA
ncbi:MAG: hypothetical protein Q9184_006653 [Pyrenodesmia sp. 2 TL-2023]